jgi:hypothetical protein
VDTLASEPAVAGRLSASKEAVQQEERGAIDKWLVWGIALFSIVVPAFFLIVISSMGSASLNFTDCKAAAGRGEFLIPDAFLLIECCRRMTRDVFPDHRFWRWVKRAVVLICAMLALACLVASVVLAIHVTEKTAKSATELTLWCLGTGFLAGTIAVAVKDGEP